MIKMLRKLYYFYFLFRIIDLCKDFCLAQKISHNCLDIQAVLYSTYLIHYIGFLIESLLVGRFYLDNENEYNGPYRVFLAG